MIDQGKDYLLAKAIKQKDHQGRIYDLVVWFLANEYSFFPATTQKDFMDAMSRIYDIDMSPPQIIHDDQLNPEHEGDY